MAEVDNNPETIRKAADVWQWYADNPGWRGSIDGICRTWNVSHERLRAEMKRRGYENG